MSKFTPFALAGMTALALGALQARADGPAPDKTDKPAADKPAKVVAPLTDESLGTMLDNMGYAARPEKLEKTTLYHLKIDQDGWTFYIDVALSNDKEQLWITSPVADVPADEKVPAETLLKLLQETNDIGPSAVYYDKQTKQISVGQPLLNLGGITPALFRSHLNQFMTDVKDVTKLCDFPKAEDKTGDKRTDDKAGDKK